MTTNQALIWRRLGTPTKADRYAPGPFAFHDTDHTLAQLRAAEDSLDFTARLVLTEELKDLPFGAVWEEFCARLGCPTGRDLIGQLDAYQASVAGRG